MFLGVPARWWLAQDILFRCADGHVAPLLFDVDGSGRPCHPRCRVCGTEELDVTFPEDTSD